MHAINVKYPPRDLELVQPLPKNLEEVQAFVERVIKNYPRYEPYEDFVPERPPFAFASPKHMLGQLPKLDSALWRYDQSYTLLLFRPCEEGANYARRHFHKHGDDRGYYVSLRHPPIEPVPPRLPCTKGAACEPLPASSAEDPAIPQTLISSSPPAWSLFYPEDLELFQPLPPDRSTELGRFETLIDGVVKHHGSKYPAYDHFKAIGDERPVLRNEALEQLPPLPESREWQYAPEYRLLPFLPCTESGPNYGRRIFIVFKPNIPYYVSLRHPPLVPKHPRSAPYVAPTQECVHTCKACEAVNHYEPSD